MLFLIYSIIGILICVAVGSIHIYLKRPLAIVENDFIYVNDMYLKVHEISIFKGYSLDTATLRCSRNIEKRHLNTFKRINVGTTLKVLEKNLTVRSHMTIAHIRITDRSPIIVDIELDNDFFG